MIDFLKVVEGVGYTPKEAFKNISFDPFTSLVPNCNATNAWKRAGKPAPGTVSFKKFALNQLNRKTRKKPGYGLYIITDPPQHDTRILPFKVINPKVKGKRHWDRMFFIREDEITLSQKDGEVNVDIVTEGKFVAECYTKAEAIDTMKKLTTLNRKSYSAIAVKIPNRDKIAAICAYTPSKAAKRGKFVAFGISTND